MRGRDKLPVHKRGDRHLQFLRVRSRGYTSAVVHQQKRREQQLHPHPHYVPTDTDPRPIELHRQTGVCFGGEDFSRQVRLQWALHLPLRGLFRGCIGKPCQFYNQLRHRRGSAPLPDNSLHPQGPVWRSPVLR